VPRIPGALSALGILRADVTKDLSQTIRLQIRNASETRSALDREFSKLRHAGYQQMRAEGFLASEVQIDRTLDMRYSGQSYELMVPYSRDYVTAFHQAHEQRYGYSDRSRPCEVVNVRARFTGRTAKPKLPKMKPGGECPRGALVSAMRAWFAGRRRTAPVYAREKLLARNRLAGPAIVMEYSATTLIPPRWSGYVDFHGNIILEPRR
jgi:N-methylhydantoinase A